MRKKEMRVAYESWRQRPPPLFYETTNMEEKNYDVADVYVDDVAELIYFDHNVLDEMMKLRYV